MLFTGGLSNHITSTSDVGTQSIAFFTVYHVARTEETKFEYA